jgi:hypothetical protein
MQIIVKVSYYEVVNSDHRGHAALGSLSCDVDKTVISK